MRKVIIRTDADREMSLGTSNLGLRIAKGVIVIGLLVIMLYPLLWLVSASLRPSHEAFVATKLIPDEFVWKNYVRGWTAFKVVTFGRMLFNSIVVAVGSILGNLIACSLAAFAFARLRFPMKNILFFVMLSTLMLPYHVLAVPQYMLFNWLGWLNTFRPLVVPKFLATDAFFIFLMVQFMRGLPRELDESALADGAGYFTIYRRIILPLSLPALTTTTIFTFIFSWNGFFAPLIFLTKTEKMTAPLGLTRFLDQESASEFGPMFAMALVSLIPIFVFFIVSQKYLTRGIATTGLK